MTDDLEVLDVGIGGETPSDFAALGVLRMRVAANLAAMNISAPNALQSACFGPLLGGRDAIVQAHTGSGKTIAFLLPLIEQLDPSSSEPQALVISPSRELAFQTAPAARRQRRTGAAASHPDRLSLWAAPAPRARGAPAPLGPS